MPNLADEREAILAWHKDNETSRRLATIPGIGPITASAIVATVTDSSQFHSARQFAAWIGLVPKQNSSGGKERQGGISKQGDRYLRRLLVVGCDGGDPPCPHQGHGANDLAPRRARAPASAAASVAQANKTARIVWALMARGETYRAPGMGQVAVA